MKFKKKPVVIEAEQFITDGAVPFQGYARYRANPTEFSETQVFDVLHQTWVLVHDGDWIIKGLKGEFYPCVDDVFRASYDQEV